MGSFGLSTPVLYWALLALFTPICIGLIHTSFVFGSFSLVHTNSCWALLTSSHQFVLGSFGLFTPVCIGLFWIIHTNFALCSFGLIRTNFVLGSFWPCSTSFFLLGSFGLAHTSFVLGSFGLVHISFVLGSFGVVHTNFVLGSFGLVHTSFVLGSYFCQVIPEIMFILPTSCRQELGKYRPSMATLLGAVSLRKQS